MEHQSVRTGSGSKIHRCWFHCDIHNERDMRASVLEGQTWLQKKHGSIFGIPKSSSNIYRTMVLYIFFESLIIPNCEPKNAQRS